MPRSNWTRDGYSRRHRALPRDWPARRRRTLARAGYQCEIATPGLCTGRATDADHAGDRDDHDNLRAACGPCHRHRTSGQGGQVIADRAAARNRPPEQHPGMIR